MAVGVSRSARRAEPEIRRGRSDRRLEQLFRACVAILAVVTLAIVAAPVVHGHAVAPAADVALDTLALIVSGTVTVLAATRFVEQRAPIALFQAAAFLNLAIAYGVAVVISLGRDIADLTSADPNDPQAYLALLARGSAATLLVVGGADAGRRFAASHRWGILVAPALLLIGATCLVAVTSWSPPPALWLAVPDPDLSGLPAATLFGMIVEVLVAALFFQAAFVCRDRWRRDHAVGDLWMAIGLVFAAFAEIQWAAYPAAHPGQVSIADLLRLVFFVSLLIGIEAEARSALARLAAANVELAALREADVERAGLEERARLARELHDGLAQDLWLAKLKAGQLGALSGLSPAASTLVSETEAAIDTGLVEARQAVMALRLMPDHELGFGEILRRYIEDFEDRFGVRVEFSHSGNGAAVAPRTQAEVLRIVQEALVNVRQHAQATVVGVRLEIEGERLTLRVADNGLGFDVAASARSSFGLSSMRERAALIGGRLRISSTKGEGTRVSLVAPLNGSPRPVEVAAG